MTIEKPADSKTRSLFRQAVSEDHGRWPGKGAEAPRPRPRTVPLGGREARAGRRWSPARPCRPDSFAMCGATREAAHEHPGPLAWRLPGGPAVSHLSNRPGGPPRLLRSRRLLAVLGTVPRPAHRRVKLECTPWCTEFSTVLILVLVVIFGTNLSEAEFSSCLNS